MNNYGRVLKQFPTVLHFCLMNYSIYSNPHPHLTAYKVILTLKPRQCQFSATILLYVYSYRSQLKEMCIIFSKLVRQSFNSVSERSIIRVPYAFSPVFSINLNGFLPIPSLNCTAKIRPQT